MTQKDYQNAVCWFEPDPSVRDRVRAAAERRCKPRLMRPLRRALAAACVVLALVGTVAAAQFSGVRIDWQVEHPFASGSNYSARVDTARFPADSFPQGIQDMAASASLSGKNFESWAELEEFLGRSLPHSTALESAQPGPRATVSGSKNGTNILLHVLTCQEGISSIGATGHYVLDGIWVQQSARLYTDKAEENYQNAGMEFDPGDIISYEEGCEMAEETYTTPSGLTATIVRVTPPEGGVQFVTEYNAHFSLGGIQYTVTASAYTVGYSPATIQEDPAHTLEVLKAVLDGFTVTE